MPTVFGSRNWDPDHLGWTGLGEVHGAARTWVDGANPGSALGLNVCGTPGQWIDGDPLPPAEPEPVDDSGTPLCCLRAANPLPPLVTDCPDCPLGATTTYFCHLDGLLNGVCECESLNGEWVLSHAGECGWVSVPRGQCSGYTWILTLDRSLAPGQWVITLRSNEDPLIWVATWISAEVDCLTPIRLNVNSQAAGQFWCFAPATEDCFIDLVPGPHQ
jgi:hypothetical protein